MNPNKRENLLPIAQKDVDVLEEKGRTYGPSWRQRGGVGAFMMLARKWDRLENICRDNFGYDVFRAWTGSGTGDSSIAEQVRDLRRYLLLVEDYCVNGEPNEEVAEMSERITPTMWVEIEEMFARLEARYQFEGVYGNGVKMFTCKFCRKRIYGRTVVDANRSHEAACDGTLLAVLEGQKEPPDGP